MLSFGTENVQARSIPASRDLELFGYLLSILMFGHHKKKEKEGYLNCESGCGTLFSNRFILAMIRSSRTASSELT